MWIERNAEIQTYTNMYKHIYTYICTYAYTYTYVCIDTYTYVCVYDLKHLNSGLPYSIELQSNH